VATAAGLRQFINVSNPLSSTCALTSEALRMPVSVPLAPAKTPDDQGSNKDPQDIYTGSRWLLGPNVPVGIELAARAGQRALKD
jgi:hypothetical protein